ncbi:MAG: PAS domain S-box protein [Desulfobacterales bacterium]|nr:PAS domain S-box protein [Desulfobacterales bacterium]
MGFEMNKREMIQELEKLRNSEKHYRRLLDESGDPTFSFYADGTYRYVNKAFAQGVGKHRDDIIGRKIWDLFENDEAEKRFAIVKKVFADGQTEEIEVRVPLPSGDTYYLTTAKPIVNTWGEVETVICTSKNITKRKLAEDALREEHNKLLAALKEIKILSGLLPICAACKKIRDDKGYWNQIESYINEHSEAEFSHSICPDCAQNLYPHLGL